MKESEVNASNAAENNGVIVAENTGTVVNNYYNGMSPRDAVQQSLVLFQASFPSLEKVAANIARARVDEIANELFAQIVQKCPNKFGRFSDPDIQCNLIEIETAYARSGKAELKNTLSGLLIKRVQSDNDLESICLNEAIKLVPSLTSAQLDLLSFKFLVGYTHINYVTDINSLTQYMQTFLLPFVQHEEPSQKDMAHLTSFRCGQYSMMTSCALGIALVKNYRSAFNITDSNNIDDLLKNPFMGTPDNYSKIKIMDNGNEVNIDQYILLKVPIASKIFHYYDNWLLNFDLTSLGILIGAINAEAKLGVKLDLSIWI
ncbi:hypothetical protein FACS189485_05010 [Spirochaetia bacterium]|nr:hypothetical protein FACS189485_05010 [Spirochaetia bacterium]